MFFDKPNSHSNDTLFLIYIVFFMLNCRVEEKILLNGLTDL